MSKLVFGYWKVRGAGQFIRHLLAYSGQQFEEVQYDSYSLWNQEDRLRENLDFPSLPYLLDGEFRVTEINAIAQYIVKKTVKSELLGKNAEDRGKIHTMIAVVNEAFKGIRDLFWKVDFQVLKQEVFEKASIKLNILKKFIGENNFAFGYLTIIDFLLAQNCYYFQRLFKERKQQYEFLWRIRSLFEAIPQIKGYYRRKDALKEPFLPIQAPVSLTLPRIKLGYWEVRGKAQVSRLLLAYSNVKFEDYTYKQRTSWFEEDKKNLGLIFPNLPYLFEGDFNLTQSSAIQQFIIQRWGNEQLRGKNMHDSARIHSFLLILNEFSNEVEDLFFNPNHEQAKIKVLEKHQKKIEELQKFIGEKDFVIGYLTLADFIVAQVAPYLQAVYPNEYKNWTAMQRIRHRFNEIPQIVEYYKSSESFKGQFMPPTAYYNIPINSE